MFKKALIVGIDDYGANSLKGCCNDANCISEMLGKTLMKIILLILALSVLQFHAVLEDP